MKTSRQPRRKAGRPIGFLIPAHMPNVELTDGEFAEIARAINLSVDEAASRPGCAVQGFDAGFRRALDYAFKAYVNDRLASPALASEREVAAALKERAALAAAVAEIIMSPAVLDGATSTAAGTAWAMIAPEVMAASKALLALANAAAEKAKRLNDSARQPKKREAIDTADFVATLREILKAAGVKAAIGSLAYADTAHERPMFKVTSLMLGFALARIGNGAAGDEPRKILDMKPKTFVEFIASAKIP